MQQYGPYRILGKLGEGGMGEVYRAQHTHLNELVALKVLPTKYERDAEAVARFCQEARTLAQVKHANIVMVRDASLDKAPYFFAMEFCGGLALDERLRQGPLPPTEALRILKVICSALDHAHRFKVYHRDIKPANVLFDMKDRPVLIDFGIAHVANTGDLTIVGTKMGTPHYMSREQAQGKEIDHRSDLYSAAVIFFEMLTGRRPFEGQTSDAVLYQVVHQQPPSVTNLCPALRGFPEINGVMAKALAKDPQQRYQSGCELLAAARQALTPGQSSKRPGDKIPPIPFLCLLAVLAAAVLVGPKLVGDRSIRGGGCGPPPPPPPPMGPVVPDLAGMTPLQAKSALVNEAKGEAIPYVFVYKQDLGKDAILKQEPQAGKRLTPGEKVRITLGTGYVTMPRIQGRPQADAEKMLKDRGLSPKFTAVGGVQVTDPDTQRLVVAQQTPAAKTQVLPRVKVGGTLVLRIRVPKATGVSSEKAREILGNRGLTVDGAITTEDTYGEGGLVLSQRPKPDEWVARGTPVKLTVTRHVDRPLPPPPPPPPPSAPPSAPPAPSAPAPPL